MSHPFPLSVGANRSLLIVPAPLFLWELQEVLARSYPDNFVQSRQISGHLLFEIARNLSPLISTRACYIDLSYFPAKEKD
jgi:hypothetical protein